MRYLQNTVDIVPYHTEQILNSVGEQWTRFERFLILGSETGTYYVNERELSMKNVAAVTGCLRADGLRVVRAVREISTTGCAPKHAPALFVLALAASPKFADSETNAAALQALPQVARTGTELCTFAGFVEKVRGWGRSLRSAIADWYLTKPAAELSSQMLKHQRSNGWSHRDLLRLSHPKAVTAAHNALFQWAVEKKLGHLATLPILDGDLRQIRAFEQARKATGEDEIVRLIEDYRLTHDLIPAKWKRSACVWEPLLESMHYMDLVQYLGKLTAVGLLQPGSPAVALVVARIADRGRVFNSKVHPIALMSALQTYKSGALGDLHWSPVASVIDALDAAFYMAFDNVGSSGKRVYLAIDASASMQESTCNGMPHVSPAMASAVLAMMFARTQPICKIAAFHDQVSKVDIGHKDQFEWACEAISHEPRGANASLPIHDALDRGLAVDAFVILTDNETWSGDEHPVPALEEYRKTTGINAKLAVIAMAANQYGIVDPTDASQMNIVGFDATVPAVLMQFITGRSST